ncbi:MAG: HAMP domain-containing histidine kinase [Gammaproteobacteria bacterium]|nr:MAG: HAMP domain-containing histidine kinase [Gammaproteobacteria bacterium]
MFFTEPDILVVEDEPFNRDIMHKHLVHRNYKNIRFAVDGQDALNQVAEKKPDIILLDIMLPQIMGLQVLHNLRQSYSMVELPIIMVTAIDDDKRVVRALELGANDYITKPINYPILVARMQTQLSLKQLSALNTEFLANASHDLRKPLDTIRDISNRSRHKLAMGQNTSSEELLRNFDLISHSASYMQNITDYILDMQASGFGQVRLTRIPVHVENLVNEVVERHRDHANEKQIALISKHDSHKLIAEADKTRILQVLDNLLNNAIKYCTRGDSITITVRLDQDHVRVEIQDTGPGIADDKLALLFSRNIDAPDPPMDSEQHGSLGLSLCKQIVELHEGRIGAHNNADKGATFWFSLPMFKLRPVE